MARTSHSQSVAGRPDQQRAVLIGLALAGLLGLSCVLSLGLGIIRVPPGEVASALLGEAGRLPTILVLDLRLPRFLVGALSGAALATTGCLLQTALKNDLADPGLLGVSSGASLVVAIVVVFGFGISPDTLPWLALAGGLATGLIILLVTRATRDPVRMILVGAALAALFSAAIVFVVVLGSAFQIQTVYAYLTGSLIGRDWADVKRLLPWLALGLPLAFAAIRPLNLLRLGEDVAEALGLPVFRTRLLALLLAVAIMAPVVATCGPIGFVALVAPHLARALLRTGDLRPVLPVAMLVGACLLVGADLAAREAMSPAELPVGLIVTTIGAPVAILLLRRHVLARAAA